MNSFRAKNWIDLGDWGKGMDGFKLPSSNGLAGKEIRLCFNVGKGAIKYSFHDIKSLTWKALEGSEKGQSEAEKYEAICIAPDIYFVDFVRKTRPDTSISMALNLGTGEATVLIATAPDREKADRSFVDRLDKGIDLSTIRVDILHASINSSSSESVMPHRRTSDLVGKRIKYTYSFNHVYEHIYLNDRLFTWHCLAGVEKGLADTEICDCFKIAPNIYLFSWREKIMPTFGVVLIDLKEMRSNGKTFGLDISSGKYVNFTMGSRAEIIGYTTLQ
jgi:hypothetical protein